MTVAALAYIKTRFGGFFFARKKYEAVLYFDGPMSKWMQCPAPTEILAQRVFKYRWIANAWAASMRGQLKNTITVVSDYEQV